MKKIGIVILLVAIAYTVGNVDIQSWWANNHVVQSEYETLLVERIEQEREARKEAQAKLLEMQIAYGKYLNTQDNKLDLFTNADERALKATLESMK